MPSPLQSCAAAWRRQRCKVIQAPVSDEFRQSAKAEFSVAQNADSWEELEIDPRKGTVENDQMLPLLFAIIVFFFLLLGSLVFVACILVPQTRRFALSAALWCALWGPCSVALMALTGLGLITAAFIGRVGDVQSFHAPKLVAAFGWGYLIVGALVTAAVATGGAWIHQVIVHRFTFALFQLYATVVSAGIGSVFGWCLGWWLLLNGVQRHALPWWIFGMVILMVGFGAAAYKGAHELRGEAPTSFTWISAEEFAGPELQ